MHSNQPPAGFKPVRNPWTQADFGIFTERMEKVLEPGETESQLCFNRTEMLRGEAPPLHIHTREDEFWIILEGEMRFWFGAANPDECIVQDASKGAVVVLPRNIPHSFTPLTDRTEFLSSFCPGCLQNIFTEIGATGKRDDEAHTDLFNKYGVHFVGPIPPVFS